MRLVRRPATSQIRIKTKSEVCTYTQRIFTRIQKVRGNTIESEGTRSRRLDCKERKLSKSQREIKLTRTTKGLALTRRKAAWSLPQTWRNQDQASGKTYANPHKPRITRSRPVTRNTNHQLQYVIPAKCRNLARQPRKCHPGLS